jgi:hypothetical protein
MRPRGHAVATRHAVPDDTLGLAAIEAPFAATRDGGVQDQADTHVVLTRLPADDHPNIAATPPHLYGPDLTVQFDHGLRLLLVGLRAQLPTTEDGPERTDGCDG